MIVPKYSHIPMIGLRSLVLMSEGYTMLEVSKELNLSSSAITIQMRNLEALLGEQVFIREGRRKYLTAFGKEAAKKAESILAINDSFFTP